MKKPFSLIVAAILLAPGWLHAQTNTPPAPPSPGAVPTRKTPPNPGSPAKPAAIPTPPVPGNTTAKPAVPANTAIQPPAPGAVPTATVPGAGTTAATGDKKGKLIPAAGSVGGLLNFQNADVIQVLDIYASLVHRTIIRPNQLSTPGGGITFKTQTELTEAEAIQALDTVLAMNGITTIPFGDKFLKVVPNASAGPEGARFTPPDLVTNLPEADQYVTVIKQLKYSKPSEVAPAITPFAKNPAGVVPLENNGIIIIRDYAANVKRMLELIDKVDQVQPLDVEMELIPIKYALAADIASVLGSLTSGGGSSSPTGTSSTSRNRSPLSTTGTTTPYTPPGVTTPTTPGGSTLGANNPNTQNRSSFQRSLQNIVNRITGPGGNNSPFLGDAKIIPDDRTNSLLIFGTKEERRMVKEVVAKLDVVQQQVLIESIIMEVSLKDGRDLGVSYAQTAKRYGNDFQGFGGVNNGDFLSSTNSGPVLPSSLPGGFSYFGNLGNNWQAAMTAIATDSSVNVLSRPRIQTSHAMEATLFVGDTVPYVTGTYFGGINGQASSQYQEKEVGITLTVLPLINQDGLVVMDINQNIEQLGTPTKIDGNDVPTTTKRQASARVAVKDGDTIILGGFISSNKQNSKSGVPYLKDIPIFGVLFRSSSKASQRTELIVLIRPTVLPDPTIAAEIAAKERAKLSAVKRAEMEITEEENLLHKEAETDIKKSERKKGNSSQTNAAPATVTTPAPAPAPAATPANDK